jgi:hypothetical protein
MSTETGGRSFQIFDGNYFFLVCASSSASTLGGSGILSLPRRAQKRPNPIKMRYWEIIADNLSASGWSWGCVSAIDSEGRKIWIADAHRGDRKRFVVRADENLTAFLELGVADSH